jgi:hypothetical protein
MFADPNHYMDFVCDLVDIIIITKYFHNL